MDFDVLVEIPAMGSVKYEIDEGVGKLRVDRFLHTSMHYPFNYGSIMETKGKDGDPLDACIFSMQPVAPGVLMKCHAIGLLEMEDEGGIDTKIIAVPDKKIDPVYGAYTSLKDLPEHFLKITKHFWDHMKELEPNKWVKTGEYKEAEAAEKEIQESTK